MDGLALPINRQESLHKPMIERMGSYMPCAWSRRSTSATRWR